MLCLLSTAGADTSTACTDRGVEAQDVRAVLAAIPAVKAGPSFTVRVNGPWFISSS